MLRQAKPSETQRFFGFRAADGMKLGFSMFLNRCAGY